MYIPNLLECILSLRYHNWLTQNTHCRVHCVVMICVHTGQMQTEGFWRSILETGQQTMDGMREAAFCYCQNQPRLYLITIAGQDQQEFLEGIRKLDKQVSMAVETDGIYDHGGMSRMTYKETAQYQPKWTPEETLDMAPKDENQVCIRSYFCKAMWGNYLDRVE